MLHDTLAVFGRVDFKQPLELDWPGSGAWPAASSQWIWLRRNRCTLYPLCPMANNSAPATKADLQGMKEEILKAIADMNDVMQRQFQFVAEGINALQKDVAELREDIDDIQEDVQEILRDAKSKHREFDVRIRRCERRLGIAA